MNFGKRIFLVWAGVIALLTMHNFSIAQDSLFAPAVNYGVGSGPTSVFASDLDGDGDNDLAVANYNSNNVSILRNNGDGTFQAAVNYGAGSAPQSIFACDLDNDGDNDLAVANWSSNQVSILRNLSNTGPPPHCAYLPGDINGDDLRLDGDVTYGVRFFKQIGNRPPDSCYHDSINTTRGHWLYVAGDVNGNCEFRASDITRLVAYFKLIAPLQYCHFFPPPPMRESRQGPLILPKD